MTMAAASSAQRTKGKMVVHRRNLLAIAAVLAIASCMATDTVPTDRTVARPDDPASQDPGTIPTPEIRQFTRLLNAARNNAGLPGLRNAPELSEAAQAHAVDMARRGYFGHRSPSGASVGDRVLRAGYDFCETGENIAQGSLDTSGVLEIWMASPGHRRNILNASYEEFGLARAGAYWVLVLGRRCRT